VSWTHERARVASLSRSRTSDDPDLIAARLNLRAERLALYIRRTVDTAPPLSPEQRDRLALLLRGGPLRPTTDLSIRRNTSAEAVGQPCPEALAGDAA
jgi:hypothetical protein